MAQAALKKQWLKYYLEEGSPTYLNATQSAISAGYQAKNKNTFAQVGFKLRREFEPKISKWLDDHGFSDARLKAKVLSLMEAKETKFFAHEGIVTDQRDVEALGIQAKATDMALKVKGIYAAEKHEI